ncbi:MAG: adenylate/guanylate cyclase domain-containing protein [Phenylobacterium sp.]
MASERARRTARRLAALLAVSLALSLAALAPTPLARFGEDLLLPVARKLAPPRPPPRVSLILIDEATHAAAPFSQTPEVAWTPYLAQVLEAVADAKPAVVGLDVIYPKTLATPDLLPGHDRPFLQALARLGRSGKLVLSETRLSGAAIVPYPGQVIAAGGPGNLRPAHFAPDADAVVRRHPASFPLEDGGRVPSLAAELADRAGRPASGDFLIDFRRPASEFPAWRLSDLLACARAGRTDVFESFRDQVVLIGVALDVEDRHLAAERFASGKAPQVRTTDCAPAAAGSAPERQTTSGVLIQARAVDTLLRGSAPRALAAGWTLAVGLSLFLLLSLAYQRAAPLTAAGLLALAAALIWSGSALALSRGLLVPWMAWTLGAGLLLALVHGWRLVVEGRERRQVLHAFRHYLSPALVERLAEDPGQLKLGGERRRVAVMFVDLEGFTSFSARHADQPEHVVARLNALFAAIGAVVDRSGGYVDKFMGDAAMAVWGAPAAAQAPEAAAARAALETLAAVQALNAASAGEPPLRVRIGLSAGEVIAGNLGSPQRYNYTVIGDAVNRAARLEEACKAFGEPVLADGEIARALPGDAPVRSLGETQLRGLPAPIEVFALAGPAPQRAEEQSGGAGAAGVTSLPEAGVGPGC